MHTQISVIHREGPVEIMAQRAEVMWPDGSTIGLHPVHLNGLSAIYLRAVQHAGHWVVFDLRPLSAEIGPELRQLPRRDTAAHVFAALRREFSNAGACMRAALEQEAVPA